MTTKVEPKITIRKVVFGLKEGMGSIGISAEGCDPYFKIQPVATMVELVAHYQVAEAEAQARWNEAAQHPEYKRPEPPAAPRTPRAATTTRPAPAPKPDQNPKMF